MKLPIRSTIQARQDIRDLYDRFCSDASQATADRFRADIDRTFASLASAPGLGARLNLEENTPAHLRFIPLSSRFKRYLVIYQPLPDRIEIVRVVHGARDLATLLGPEQDDEDA